MKKSEYFPEDFEKLILNKSFSELSSEELEMLEAEGLSEQEFNKVKVMLTALLESEKEQHVPSPEIKTKLLEAFNNPSQKNGRIISLQTWIISALSAAAIITLAVFIFKPDLDPAANKQELSQQLDSGKPNVESGKNFLPQKELNDTVPQIGAIPEAVPESFMEAVIEAPVNENEAADQSFSGEPEFSAPQVIQNDIQSLAVESKMQEESLEPSPAPVKEEVISTKSVTMSTNSAVSKSIVSNGNTFFEKTSEPMSANTDLFAKLVTVY